MKAREEVSVGWVSGGPRQSPCTGVLMGPSTQSRCIGGTAATTTQGPVLSNVPSYGVGCWPVKEVASLPSILPNKSCC